LDDATAIHELEEVVHLAPRKVEVYHMLALTYERMRMNDEAIRVLQRIQSLNYDYFIEQNLDQLLRDIQERG
jgi:Tfp pilus assembly protein PilF